jgi:hypothetical protein
VKAVLTNAEHPVAWAMLMYELADARDHLGALIDQMTAEGAIAESDFQIQLGHVFAHLNRAWHGRDDTRLDEVSGELHAERSKFPNDLAPVG